MKNNLYTLDIKQGKLIYTPENKHSLQNYAIEWLASWRNDYFLKWEQFSSGNNTSLYSDISTFIPFEEFLAFANIKDLYYCISYICEIVKAIDNSILEPSKILFDIKYIFVEKHKQTKLNNKISNPKQYSIKLLYLPDKNYMQEKPNGGYKNLLTTLANLIIKKDTRKSSKEKQQKLLLAIEENNLEEVFFLCKNETKLNKKQYFIEKTNINKIIKSLERIDWPIIFLVITIGLICSIFIINNQVGYIKKSTLSLIVGLIIMNLILELVLLFSPSSPFRIVDYSNFKRKKDQQNPINNIKNNQDIDKDYSGLKLHPLSQYRIGQLLLVDGATQISGSKTWNVASSEFLIGTNEKADLNLPINSTEVILMRIIQRSGTFFLESLSKNVSIKIEDRNINRYQEYEISNYIHFSIDRFHFSLEIK